MPTLVYGPDTFTVGANTNLSTYNAAWTVFGSSADPSVRTGTNDLRYASIGTGARAKWTGTVNADQRIVADITTGSATQSFPALTVRMGSNFTSGYIAQWSPQLGRIELYRVTGSYTLIAFLGTVANSTTYTDAYLKATGSGATVTLEFGDNTNGFTTFADTDAARFTTGQPGVDIYEGTTANTGALDNLRIYDEAAAPGAALTGVAGTGAVGTVGKTHDNALTGNAGTTAVGTVKANNAIGLTGNAGTGAAGTVKANTVIGLTGVAGTGAVGTVSASSGGDVTVGLTGVQGTGATGTLSPATVVAITGVAATGAVGTLTAAPSKALTGVAGTGSVGTLAPATVVPLTGVQATGQVGNVSIAGDVTAALTGVSATGQVGTVSVATGTSSGSGGGIVGRKRRRFSIRTAKKEFDFLKEVQEALIAEVQEIEAQSTDDLTPEESATLARNVEVVTKKYEQAKKLGKTYSAELAGIDDALALAQQRMQSILDDEMQYVIQLIVEMDDDARP